MIVKIYGERNTGTNYLMQLLARHVGIIKKNGSAFLVAPTVDSSFDLIAQSELGWKHRLITADFLQESGVAPDSALIVALVKNPYSWLLSLHKRPYSPIHLRHGVISRDKEDKPLPHSARNIKIIRNIRRFGRLGKIFLSRYPQWSEYETIAFKDFIRAKWFVQFGEGCDKAFANPVQLWNAKNKAYIELQKSYNVLLFTYEELLASPEVIMKKVMNYLGCELQGFENLHQAAKEEDKEKNHEYYRDYYLNEHWREDLSRKEIKWISSQLDPLVMKSFGYQFL